MQNPINNTRGVHKPTPKNAKPENIQVVATTANATSTSPNANKNKKTNTQNTTVVTVVEEANEANVANVAPAPSATGITAPNPSATGTANGNGTNTPLPGTVNETTATGGRRLRSRSRRLTSRKPLSRRLRRTTRRTH